MEFLSWIARQFGQSAEQGYREWYGSLVKPVFAPEPWVFGVAWGIIYPLIAIAFVWMLYLWRVKKLDTNTFALFLCNLLLNLTFSATLLSSFNNVWISLHILAVLATLLWFEVLVWKQSRFVFWILMPYVLWGTFATCLQLSLTALN